MKKTVYIAGPMRGYDQFNFPSFDAAAAKLRADGWIVLNPAEHDRESGFDETLNNLDGFDMRKAFRWDMNAILRSDAIYMLPGWEKSSGATIEKQVAEFVGSEVLFAPVTVAC